MRLQDRPRWQASASRALRRLRRRGRRPSARSPSPACTRPTAGCSTRARRCSTPARRSTAACSCSAFESADHPVDAGWTARSRSAPRPRRHRWRAAARRRRAEDGGRRRLAVGVPADAVPARRAGPAWRDRRDVRDRLHLGPLRGPARRRDRRPPARRVEQVSGGGVVTCRFTHVYPDGPAPYFTVSPPAGRGAEVGQWDEIKAAASEALAAHGATITHHHAVGRDHRPWYDRQRPDAVRRRAGRGQGGARPGRRPQPRRAAAGPAGPGQGWKR